MKGSSVITVIAGAALLMITPLIFIAGKSGFPAAGHLFLSWHYWLFIIFYFAVYFILSRMALPVLYAKKKFTALSLVLLMLFVSSIYIHPYDNLVHHTEKEPGSDRFRQMPTPGANLRMPGPIEKGRRPLFDIISVFLSLITFLVVLADYVLKQSRAAERRAIQAEADKAQAELSFFKAQINPHFLFNTLNNIYSLAVTKNENTADSVMKLSNIMRYITDEGNETMVPLQDEIDCINNYISLQKLRLGENIAIHFSVEGNVAGKKIPPLILMTFIENAFKHGISNHESASIDIHIAANGGRIDFATRNKQFIIPRNIERTGIGIENTRKRLQVLYADKHALSIIAKDNVYAVDLELKDL